jgi:uncharacterized protein
MLSSILNIIKEFWSVFEAMAPYLLFGFLVAGFLSVLISPAFVERHLGGRKFMPVLKATLFGIPLPLCSCSVLPVTASLRRHGASRGAATGFLISTPQTGVDSIMVTFSLLGPVFAIFRPLVALVGGLLGGMTVSLFEHKGITESHAIEKCEEVCCSPQDKRHWFRKAIHYGFVTLPEDIGKALLIGLLIAGLISAVIPKDYFAGIIGTGFVAMLVMMVLGIPVYVCATASVPVAAALILKGGISPGAALVFLMTGPATNAAAIATIWKLMGKRTAITYLITIAITALGAGVLLDYIYTYSGEVAAGHSHEMLPPIAKTISAIVLAGILIYVMAPFRKKPAAQPLSEAPESATFTIKGMTCGHCVADVTQALQKLDGITAVDVDLKTGKATINGEKINHEKIISAIEHVGYTVEKTDSSTQ